MTTGSDNVTAIPDRDGDPAGSRRRVELPQPRSHPRSRRRGAQLQDAIRAAALAELSGSGYGGFSMESVAARAQTGKASIYRRWTSKAELLLDSFCAMGAAQCTPDMSVGPDATTAEALAIVATRITAVMSGEAGAIMRELVGEATRDPELAQTIEELFHQPRRTAMLDLLRRGVRRGEVRPDAVCDAVAQVLPAILAYRILWLGETVTDADARRLVDDILLPLVRA